MSKDERKQYGDESITIGVFLIDAMRAAAAILSLMFTADVLAGLLPGSRTPKGLILYQFSAICFWLASFEHSSAPVFYTRRFGNLVASSLWLIALLIMCSVFIVCYAWHAMKSTKYRMAVQIAADRLEASGQVDAADAMRRMEPMQHLKVRASVTRGDVLRCANNELRGAAMQLQWSFTGDSYVAICSFMHVLLSASPPPLSSFCSQAPF